MHADSSGERETLTLPLSKDQHRIKQYRSHRVERNDCKEELENPNHHFRCQPHIVTSHVSSAYDRFNYEVLVNIPFAHNWKWQKNVNGFAIFTHQEMLQNQQKYYVLVYGTVKHCSVVEMKQTLQSPTDVTFNAFMNALFGDQYLHGFVHQSQVIGIQKCSNNDAQEEHLEKVTADEECNTYIRSCRWIKSRPLSRNEEWRYLDFVCDDDPDGTVNGVRGFVHAFSTVNPKDQEEEGNSETTTSKSVKLGQRRGIHGGILIREEENDAKAVRAQFYAECTVEQFWWFSNCERTTNSNIAGSRRKGKNHVMQLAQGITRLPEVIRRRRLGYQVFADTAAFDAKNKHCICCTKRLSMFISKRKRCNLCGNAICPSCSRMDQVEIKSTISSIRICERCLELVNECDYDSLAASSYGHPSVIATLERVASSASLMVDMLQDVYDNADSAKKKTVVSVIKSMLAADAEKESLGSALEALSQSGATEDNNESNECIKELLKDHTLVRELPVEECHLSNGENRNYSIDYRALDDASKVPHRPLSKSEQIRVEHVRKHCFREYAGEVKELEVLCSLAAKELECKAGAITILDADEQHIVISNEPIFNNVTMPLDQSICSHIVMDPVAKPLLVPSTASDIRFKNFDNAVRGVINFYFGYPITSPEGTVVGALCCFDPDVRSVSNVQYSIMKKLAETVSGVLAQFSRAGSPMAA